jgi:hypothetical protein
VIKAHFLDKLDTWLQKKRHFICLQKIKTFIFELLLILLLYLLIMIYIVVNNDLYCCWPIVNYVLEIKCASITGSTKFFLVGGTGSRPPSKKINPAPMYARRKWDHVHRKTPLLNMYVVDGLIFSCQCQQKWYEANTIFFKDSFCPPLNFRALFGSLAAFNDYSLL